MFWNHPLPTKGFVNLKTVFQRRSDEFHKMNCSRFCCCVSSGAVGFCGVDSLAINFIGAAMPHWCRVPELENLPFEIQVSKQMWIPQWPRSSFPCKSYILFTQRFCKESCLGFFLSNYVQLQQNVAIPFSDGDEYAECEHYQLNYGDYSVQDFLNWNRSAMVDADSPITSCANDWVYDRSQFKDNLVSQVGYTHTSVSQASATLARLCCHMYFLLKKIFLQNYVDAWQNLFLFGSSWNKF